MHSNPEDMTVMELLELINNISDGYNDSDNLKGLIGDGKLCKTCDEETSITRR